MQALPIASSKVGATGNRSVCQAALSGLLNSRLHCCCSVLMADPSATLPQVRIDIAAKVYMQMPHALQVSRGFAHGWVKLMSIIHTVMDNDTVPTAVNVKRSIGQSSLRKDVLQYLAEGGRSADATLSNLILFLHLLPHQSVHLTIMMQGKSHPTFAFSLACIPELSALPLAAMPVELFQINSWIAGLSLLLTHLLVAQGRRAKSQASSACTLANFCAVQPVWLPNLSAVACRLVADRSSLMQLSCADHDLVLHNDLLGKQPQCGPAGINTCDST